MKIFIRKNFLTADLHYPERGRTHREIVEAIEEFKFTDNTIVATLSDVVIKQINIHIMRKRIDYRTVEVYSDFDDDPITVRREGFEVPSIDTSIQFLNFVANNSFRYLESCYDDLLGCTINPDFQDIVRKMALDIKQADSLEDWFEEDLRYYSQLIKRLKDECESNSN
jgi:hypothetical protein